MKPMQLYLKLAAKIKHFDKVVHFVGGLIAAVIAYYFVPTPGAAIVAAVVVGLVKEFYDNFHPEQTVDVWDWVATSAGCLPVLIFHFWRQ